MISHSRYVVLVCILSTILNPGCCNNTNVVRDGFRLEYTINNPARSFHARLVFETNPDDSLIGLMYIARTAKESGILDYREDQKLRQSTGDTLFLSSSKFLDLLNYIGVISNTVKPSIVYGQSDGKIINISLKFSGKDYDWRVFGKTEEVSINRLMDFIETTFEETYPAIVLNEQNTRIELSLSNHLHKETNFLMYSNNNTITIQRDSLSAYPLEPERYLNLWQVLEANDVWRLRDNGEMENKYPTRYVLKIQMGTKIHSWSVFAPMYLDDRRYLRIAQAIEATALSH